MAFFVYGTYFTVFVVYTSGISLYGYVLTAFVASSLVADGAALYIQIRPCYSYNLGCWWKQVKRAPWPLPTRPWPAGFLSVYTNIIPVYSKTESWHHSGENQHLHHPHKGSPTPPQSVWTSSSSAAAASAAHEHLPLGRHELVPDHVDSHRVRGQEGRRARQVAGVGGRRGRRDQQEGGGGAQFAVVVRVGHVVHREVGGEGHHRVVQVPGRERYLEQGNLVVNIGFLVAFLLGQSSVHVVIAAIAFLAWARFNLVCSRAFGCSRTTYLMYRTTALKLIFCTFCTEKTAFFQAVFFSRLPSFFSN